MEPRILKRAELLLRLTMIVTLVVAGVSKFYSHGGFHDYYLELFTKPTLRIQLPRALYDVQLALIPYVEVGLGLAMAVSLFVGRFRRSLQVAWVFYFISLEVGHYILEEWVEVDVMIPIIMLGVFAYILPAYDNVLTDLRGTS